MTSGRTQLIKRKVRNLGCVHPVDLHLQKKLSLLTYGMVHKRKGVERVSLKGLESLVHSSLQKRGRTLLLVHLLDPIINTYYVYQTSRPTKCVYIVSTLTPEDDLYRISLTTPYHTITRS